MVEDVVIIGGLIGVQFIYAGNSILLSYLMSLGLSPLTLVIFSSFATFLVISPPAILLERSKWPREFSCPLWAKMVLIAISGVLLFQSLFLKGMKMTSPALATAMPNLAPGLIFVIAWASRFERVDLNCVYSKVKLVGTLLCIVGAVTMSLMHSTASAREGPVSAPPVDTVFDRQKIIGCFYLLAAVFVLSCNVVLQAATLAEFPAPLSLCAVTSLIGAVLAAALQLFQDHGFQLVWPLIDVGNLIIFSFLGGAVGGGVVSFNGWAMKKRGPVLVSIFSPIGTVISVVLSAVTLGDSVNVGSVAGMFLMFAGLYMVLWAKGKESYPENNVADLESPKEPLLSYPGEYPN